MYLHDKGVLCSHYGGAIKLLYYGAEMRVQSQLQAKQKKRTAPRRAGALSACALCAKYSRPNATTRRALTAGPEGDMTFATVEEAFEYLMS